MATVVVPRITNIYALLTYNVNTAKLMIEEGKLLR